MFTKIDKAMIAAFVAFVSATSMAFFQVEIDATVQNAIVAGLAGLFVYAVPNKKA